MSKNFELMRRAGKNWTFAPPPSVEDVRTATHAEKSPALEKVERPAAVVPIRPKSWGGATHPAQFDMDQLAREESLRLVQRIFLLPGPAAPRIVVFAGINHGNGCSRICAHAAEALESHGRGAVCLVEANLRSPSLPRIFGTSNHHGLTDSLLSDGPIRDFAKPLHTDRFWLLSSGSLGGDSHGLLNSGRLKERFDELRREFHYVLVDAPPLSHYSDAVVLGKIADGLVLVVEANTTRREAALGIAEHLRAAHVNVLGAVLNKRTFPIPDKLYRKL